jgi:hypothetical protein
MWECSSKGGRLKDGSWEVRKHFPERSALLFRKKERRTGHGALDTEHGIVNCQSLILVILESCKSWFRHLIYEKYVNFF